MSQQTAVIWDEMQGEIKFFVMLGDLRQFNGVYVNSGEDNEKEELLIDTVYDKKGQHCVKFCSIEDFATAVREGAFITVCGFLP